jgi:flagellar biosynthetic protein FlhB
MPGERTEEATPQRREKARKEGDLLHSRELSSAAGTVAGVLLLGAAAPKFVAAWAGTLEACLRYGKVAAWEASSTSATLRALRGVSAAVLAPVAVVASGVVVAALGVGVMQTGGVQVHPQRLQWKLDRLNPLSNVKNLFSLRSVTRLAKSMLPAALLAVFAVRRLESEWEMPPFSTTRLLALAGDVYALLLTAAWLLFGWAAIDYLVEWRSREQRLKMSRQEIREEYKQSEGNPQIRGRIRNLQRAARRRRVKADVAKAAVVVTNPTHYAVALDFDFATMDAPRVLAKGRNLLAEEIKDEARWAGVPILENAPLAQSLYKLVEPGEAIPVELYAAVASILAFLYRQRVEQEMRQRRERAQAARPSARENGVASNPPDRATGRAAGPATSQAAVILAGGKKTSSGRRTGHRSTTTPGEKS